MCPMMLPTGDEEGKLFVGGLSWDTTKESLQEYFSQYGEIIDCVVMKNQQTGKSRGFGFVTYKDPNCVNVVLSSGPHILDDRQIDPKACNPRSLNKGSKTPEEKGRKIFIGGLPPSANEESLRQFFSQHGKVTEVVIMYDQQKTRSRGFGFLSFETQEQVDRVCQQHFFTINGKQIEVKPAEPRGAPNKPGGGGDNRQRQSLSPQPDTPSMGFTPPTGFPPQGFPGQGQWTHPPPGATPPAGYRLPPGQGGSFNGWNPAQPGQDLPPYAQIPPPGGAPAYATPPPQQSYGFASSPSHSLPSAGGDANSSPVKQSMAPLSSYPGFTQYGTLGSYVQDSRGYGLSPRGANGHMIGSQQVPYANSTYLPAPTPGGVLGSPQGQGNGYSSVSSPSSNPDNSQSYAAAQTAVQKSSASYSVASQTLYNRPGGGALQATVTSQHLGYHPYRR